ncbi:MAG: hypothetical protein H6606_04095 [Flavobacteriales bacterium]|nr:hypothetical protein [Flavobacteriales bacterium]
MKIRRFVSVLFISFFAFHACKDKSEPEDQNSGVRDKVRENIEIMRQAVQIYETELASGDTLSALNALGEWLGSQSSVSEAWYRDLNRIEIDFANGLHSGITLIPINKNGEHQFRGSAANGHLQSLGKAASGDKIKNRKVLILMPYPNEFGYYSSTIEDLKSAFQKGVDPMEVEVKTDRVSLSDLNKLGEYGLTILDVHGETHGFNLMYLEKNFKTDDLWFPDEVIQEVFNIHSVPEEKIANGEIELELHITYDGDHAVRFRFSILVTDKYIRQLNIDLSDAVLFGNHCYSGFTALGTDKENMAAAWKSKGLATYYGYAFDNNRSTKVDNEFCKDMELILIKGLTEDLDSTGNAHLKEDGSPYAYTIQKPYSDQKVSVRAKRLTISEPFVLDSTKLLYCKQFYEKTYSYDHCDTLFIDPRDGERYKVVCIGKQVWMAENLRFAGGGGVCFDNDPAYCKKEGRLYSPFELLNYQVTNDSSSGHVQGLCPKGWHVPSNAEYRALMDFCGSTNNAVLKLRSKEWPAPPNATDEFGFNLIPTEAALLDPQTKTFKFFPNKSPSTYLWTSTGEIRSGGADSYNLFFSRSSFSMGIQGTGPTEDAFTSYPCRCIRD